MKLGGSTFAYNAIKQDYNIIETLECLSTFCEELAVCYGGDDGTIDLIENWAKGRKRIILVPFNKEQWDEQKGREKLSHFSNLAIEKLDTQWNFYLQADEILSEKSFAAVRDAIKMDVPAHLVTRHNLWNTPLQMLNVEQSRKPCSTEVIRLAKVSARCVGDAESLGNVPMCVDTFLKDIVIFHCGFVRDKKKHLEKIRHIQDEVFLIDHDKRIDGMKEFDPMVFFSEADLVPIPGKLPIFIQQWAKERYPELEI